MNLCNTEFKLPENSDKYVALLLDLSEKCTKSSQFTESQISKQMFDWEQPVQSQPFPAAALAAHMGPQHPPQGETTALGQTFLKL